MAGVVKVFRYGLLSPTSGGDVVEDQILRAHRYYNALIEIERSRRAAVRAVLDAHDRVSPLVAQAAEQAAELEGARAAIRSMRAGTRRRAAPPEVRERVAALRQQLADTRAALKQAKANLKTDTAIQAAIADVTATHKARAKAAYRASGCYWGQRALVEQAIDAARRAVMDPRFKRWTGDGAVGMQIIGGIGVDNLVTDSRLQVDTTAQSVPGRGGKPRPRLRLRVGSTADKDPVWGEWPLILHRPIPPEARILWAKVVRRQIASRVEWSAHLTLALPDPDARAEGETIAVDLGWRRQDGRIRVGGWSDGADDHDLYLPAAIEGALRKAADIRSIRDQHLNELRAALTDWRESVGTLPAEHGERLRWLPQWRSPARFAGLARWWRDHRAAGDDVVLETLEAWRKRDKHLWLYESGTRRRALARRRDTYRVWAADLARRARTLVIERLDLRALKAIPVPESERESSPVGRSQLFAAAPAEFRTALIQAVRSGGGSIVTVPPAGPALELWREARERSGGAEMPVAARISRFGRVRARQAASEAATGS